MPNPSPPLLIETHQLESYQDNHPVLLIDLCDSTTYATGHIPGAVHLDYSTLVRSQPPVMGLLPDETTLNRSLSQIGLTQNHHVIAYDNEGGCKASRLLWTLDLMQHPAASLLNGGYQAWQQESRELTTQAPRLQTSHYFANYTHLNLIADIDYIQQHLHKPRIAIMDVRSANEYMGSDRRANHGGHIPGAIHFDWLNGIDQQQGLRIKSTATLLPTLQNLGITPDKEIIVYCHTHRRSAFSYIMLKSLGYPNLRAYPGAWSEWGNQTDLPIET